LYQKKKATNLRVLVTGGPVKGRVPDRCTTNQKKGKRTRPRLEVGKKIRKGEGGDASAQRREKRKGETTTQFATPNSSKKKNIRGMLHKGERKKKGFMNLLWEDQAYSYAKKKTRAEMRKEERRGHTGKAECLFPRAGGDMGKGRGSGQYPGNQEGEGRDFTPLGGAVL